MKICLVTTFPPSQGGLSEYGLHIAQELRSDPFLSLTILADKIGPSHPELEGFSVQRCWSFDDPTSSVRILSAIAKLKPDVVWFNLLFSTFGRNPLIAFSGLLTPLLARLMGRYTHVTLHHLMDTVDLKDAGIQHPRAYRIAGALATKILLRSNSVSVLMPGYRKILHEKYGRDNVHLRSHGILTTRPEYPDFSRRGNPEHRILAFGKWGTYKRLEMMIDAFHILAERIPTARLVIAGGNHPQAAGYVESIKKKWAADSRIEFTGYLDEDRLPDLFQSSSVAVMPYTSSTGCSGVAHLACAYGVPIVCSDLSDFRQMAAGEDIAIEFYKPGSAPDLARCLGEFLLDREKQQAMAVQNFSTALRMTMPTIVQKYLRHFELQQRARALRYVTKFRKLPGWVPSKATMLRLMTRNSLGWVHRAGARQHANHRPESGRAPDGRESTHLLNSHINDSRELTGARNPADGDGIGHLRDLAFLSHSATESDHQAEAKNGTNGQSASPAAAPGLRVVDVRETSYPERQ
jgi:glycosyltransferase involved in cell wall biosynthesis